MAALDREVAEERAEAAEAEVEKLNDKISELELEVAILKEENGKSQLLGLHPRRLKGVAEYEKPVSGADGERTSLAYIQLEKHNERLKEALIRYAKTSSLVCRDAADLQVTGCVCRERQREQSQNW